MPDPQLPCQTIIKGNDVKANRHAARRIPVTALVMALLACDSGPPEPATAIPSCGDVVVPTPISDRQASLRVVDAEFGEITAAVLAGGRMYAADGLGRVVVVIDSGGAVTRRLGRDGSGPGEFRYVTYVSLLDDDRLAAFDGAQWRFTYFADDTLDAVAPVPAMPAFGQSALVGMAPDGQVYGVTYDTFQQDLEASLGRRRSGIGRGMNGVAVADTGAMAWRELFRVPGMEVHVDLDDGTLQDVWFAAQPHLTVTRGHVWSADARAGTVIRYDRASRELCAMKLQSAAVRITRAERDSFYNAADIAHRGADRVNRMRERRRGLPLPDEKPRILALFGGKGDTLWIRTPREPGTDQLMAITPAGSTAATWTVPSTDRLLHVDGGSLVVAAVTAAGVPVVHHYRLIQAGR